MQLRPLEKKDHDKLAGLLNTNLKNIYPFKEAGAEAIEVFLQDNKTVENAQTAGIFEDNILKGAACFGTLPENGKKADFDIILPGDGVILWLVCSDVTAGYELVSHCLSKLPKTVFAFPEFGSLRTLTLFNTGMLPSVFTKEETVFRSSAFNIPSGEEWGPQERCWFRSKVPNNIELLAVPEEFELKREIMEGYRSRLKLFNKGVLIGECNISNLKLFGKTFPGHFYIDWLSVQEKYRSRSFGSKLLLEQCRFAGEKGAVTCILTTHTGQPAHRLYKKLGFIGEGLSRTFCLKQK